MYHEHIAHLHDDSLEKSLAGVDGSSGEAEGFKLVLFSRLF